MSPSNHNLYWIIFMHATHTHTRAHTQTHTNAHRVTHTHRHTHLLHFIKVWLQITVRRFSYLGTIRETTRNIENVVVISCPALSWSEILTYKELLRHTSTGLQTNPWQLWKTQTCGSLVVVRCTQLCLASVTQAPWGGSTFKPLTPAWGNNGSAFSTRQGGLTPD